MTVAETVVYVKIEPGMTLGLAYYTQFLEVWWKEWVMKINILL